MFINFEQSFLSISFTVQILIGWIQIRIVLTFKLMDPDPHWEEQLDPDPDPQKIKADPVIHSPGYYIIAASSAEQDWLTFLHSYKEIFASNWKKVLFVDC